MLSYVSKAGVKAIAAPRLAYDAIKNGFGMKQEYPPWKVGYKVQDEFGYIFWLERTEFEANYTRKRRA
jgi:hypothetical protein